MIYNSTRIMNEYSISTIFDEGNEYISNCFNPSGLSVLNEINIKNIGKAIVEAIKKAFKWIWDKLKQLGAFIKKKFTDISNKIRGIDIDIEVKDKVEIIVLDSEKAMKTIQDLERAFEISMMFRKFDAMSRGFVRTRLGTINSYISSIKSFKDYAIKNGKDRIHDMNSDDNDYNKDSSVASNKEQCKYYLNILYKELDEVKEEMKKINNKELGGFLNLSEQFDVNDVCDALKKKYSFYDEDGSLKKEYQRKITIDPSYNSKQYLKKIYDESIEINKALSEACAKNTKKIYDEINDYQELANYIAKAIDESVTIIESIDSTLAEEFAKRTKELAEIAAKKAAEEARIKAEMDRIAAENAAKIAAEEARIKAEAEKKAAENAAIINTSLDNYKKEVEKMQNDEEIVNAYKNSYQADNNLKFDSYKDYNKHTIDKTNIFFNSLTEDKIKKLCSPEFTIDEFVCLSALGNRYPVAYSSYEISIDLSKINKKYHKLAKNAELKLIKLAKTKQHKVETLYRLSKTIRIKEILKDYYDKILSNNFNNEKEYTEDLDGIKEKIKDMNVSYNDIKKFYIFRYLHKFNIFIENYVDIKTRYEINRIFGYFESFCNNYDSIGINELSNYFLKIYPSIKNDSTPLCISYIKNIIHNNKFTRSSSRFIRRKDSRMIFLFYIVKYKKMPTQKEFSDFLTANTYIDEDEEEITLTNNDLANEYKKFLNEEYLFASINNYNVFGEIKFM